MADVKKMSLGGESPQEGKLKATVPAAVKSKALISVEEEFPKDPMLTWPNALCAVAKQKFFLPYLCELTGLQVDEVLGATYEDTIDVLPHLKAAATVRLDVLIKHKAGVIDIEIQKREEPALPQRIRYYQAATTLAYCLSKGQKYSKLKQCAVIFFCYKDKNFTAWRTDIRGTRSVDGVELGPIKDGAISYVFNLSAKLPDNCPKLLRELFTALKDVNFVKESNTDLARSMSLLVDKGVIEVDEKLKQYWRRDGAEEAEERAEKERESFLRRIIKMTGNSTSFHSLVEEFPELTEEFYEQVCEEECLIPIW